MDIDVADRLEIAELVAQTGLYMDRNESDRFVDLFVEDAILKIPGRPPITTHEARGQLVTSSPRGVHLTGTPVIRAGSPGEARSTQTFLFRNGTTGAFQPGWYEDDVVKRDGRWRIALRDIHYLAEPAASA